MDVGKFLLTLIRESQSVKFSLGSVMWLMLFQRINPKSSLSSAVEYFVANAPNGKNANKRLREAQVTSFSLG